MFPFEEIRKNMPTNLKISPIYMIPHKSKNFQTIFDLFFKLKIDGAVMPSVNDDTVPTAPQYSMRELERVIERMISLKTTSSIDSPGCFISKFDIKNIFED